MIWRRSYDVPPPGGESLKDTAARTLPYYEDVILPFVRIHGLGNRMAPHFGEDFADRVAPARIGKPGQIARGAPGVARQLEAIGE